ncbi:hypothetical protein ABID56_002215 [Alkalibacillus flavidus]|uniref:Uncharacterized protein n=1 Tax=Alkalibacillus flavidus TaxID=546021 RepID=A0ABV2KWX9_9BACI
MNGMMWLLIIVVLLVALAIGLSLEKLQTRSWFRSRFLTVYIIVLAIGSVAYFFVVAPSEATVDPSTDPVTMSGPRYSFENQNLDILDDLTLEHEWSVPVDRQLMVSELDRAIQTARYLFVKENNELDGEALVQWYRPSVLEFDGKLLPVDFPKVNANVHDSEIEFQHEPHLDVQYNTLSQSLFVDYFKGEGSTFLDSSRVTNTSVIVVEVPPQVDVDNQTRLQMTRVNE